MRQTALFTPSHQKKTKEFCNYNVAEVQTVAEVPFEKTFFFTEPDVRVRRCPSRRPYGKTTRKTARCDTPYVASVLLARTAVFLMSAVGTIKYDMLVRVCAVS